MHVKNELTTLGLDPEKHKHKEDDTMKITERQMNALLNLTRTAQKSDRVLKHPLETLKFLNRFDPDLDPIKVVYPWVEQHQNDDLTLNDIVKQLLQILPTEMNS